MKKFKKNNYYDILEIQSHASTYEIRRAYESIKSIYTKGNGALYTLTKPCHLQEITQKIEEAYSVLGNRSLRKLYDERTQESSFYEETLSLAALQKAANIFPNEPSHVKVEKWRSKKPLTKDLIEKGETLCDGSVLHQLREEKQISMDEMSEITKINSLYLKAVEENDLPSLPSPVFVQGFVRQMAKTLGLNHHKVVKSYMIFLRSQIVKK